MSDKQYTYSEIFHSAQGEGLYTGTPGPWLRYFMCNLQCNGFGQDDPTDESTYKLPYKDLDTSKYDKLEDLPVFEFGCDSSYSWSAKYKKLQRKVTFHSRVLWHCQYLSRCRPTMPSMRHQHALLKPYCDLSKPPVHGQ